MDYNYESKLRFQVRQEAHNKWAMQLQSSINGGNDSTSDIGVGEKTICMIKTMDVWILNARVNNDQYLN
jgi:hypothetical protein